MELCIHSNLPTLKHRTCRGIWDKRPTQDLMENRGWRTRTKSQDWIPRPGPQQLCCSCGLVIMAPFQGTGAGKARNGKDERKALMAALLWEAAWERTQMSFDSCQSFAQKALSQEMEVIQHSSGEQFCSPSLNSLSASIWQHTKTGTFSALNLTIQVYYLSFCS